MEKLTPTERAAYVLREAFDYPYVRIAEIIETTDVAARQLVSRARKHLRAGAAHAATRTAHQRLFRAFIDAARTGDVRALETLLAAEATSYTDGGGVVHRTARRPVMGRDRLLRFLHGLAEWFWRDIQLEPVEANGLSSVLLLADGKVFALLTAAVQDERIAELLWVMNPDKLRSIVGVRPIATPVPMEQHPPARTRIDSSWASESFTPATLVASGT